MFTGIVLVALAALVCTVVHAVSGWCPLWVAVLLLCGLEVMRAVIFGGLGRRQAAAPPREEEIPRSESSNI